MAAIVAAVRRKEREKKRRAALGLGPDPADEDDGPSQLEKMEAWLRGCKCWASVWKQTTLDDRFWSQQQRVSDFYLHNRTQIFVAVLIFSNFISSIVQKQIDPTSEAYIDVFEPLDNFFAIIFTVEILINMYAHWFWKFIKSGWNIFDLLIVIVGLLTMAKATQGPLKLLRLLRAFRVFRLFRRIKSLNKILMALVRAVPGVSHAFSVVLLTMSMCAAALRARTLLCPDVPEHAHAARTRPVALGGAPGVHRRSADRTGDHRAARARSHRAQLRDPRRRAVPRHRRQRARHDPAAALGRPRDRRRHHAALAALRLRVLRQLRPRHVRTPEPPTQGRTAAPL